MPLSTKRRKVASSAIEEIAWDPSARQEYLTGFHKRKQQRIQHAQKVSAEKDRQQRIADRKKLREQRKEDLERHVQQINSALHQATETFADDGAGNDDSSDPHGDGHMVWDGFQDAEEATDTAAPTDSHQEDEYVDEDKYTTVTIEQMADSDASESDSLGLPTPSSKPAPATSKQQSRAKVKKKPPKFRYETKTDRREGRRRDKVRKAKVAHDRRSRE